MSEAHSERIAVIGLGYVGLPAAVAFGRSFAGTVGFDLATGRVAELVAGRDANGDLSAEELAATSVAYTTDPNQLGAASFYVLAVPTPLTHNKEPDLSAVELAARTVGKYLAEGDMVVVESTVYPGVTEEIVGPLLAAVSGLELGVDFQLGYSPERINPGDREHGFAHVVKVVAAQDAAALDRIAAVYSAVVGPGVFRAPSIKVAETAKLIENTQRDLNIALMNELGLICDRLGIRTKDVLDTAGTKWNFLPFEPGLVGGHCISIDPYYLTAKAQALGYHPEVILAGRRINDAVGAWVAQRTVKLLAAAGARIVGARVAVLGITFKENFGDLRNSRVVEIIEELKAFGCETLVHDPLVDPDGALMSYGLALVDWDDLVDLDALVLAVRHDAYLKRPLADLLAGLKHDAVVVDVKSALDPASLPPHLTYWSL
ncbi:MAG: nucleotide sugar dehydrogenase [Deltaproteobacteria bacterium HGW-Deltaproteobacteria-14]|jgi:UDP-N-acetyl-D-galactosamine dehydrogenase|nr:MAG: nucleotide sugar dehydrogenase [Deltaproteobacteria bacterium HGW-Deltaproteobacteria-14]